MRFICSLAAIVLAACLAPAQAADKVIMRINFTPWAMQSSTEEPA